MGEGRANFSIIRWPIPPKPSSCLSSITKRFGALVANDAIDLRTGEGRGGGASGRERRRQDDADEHPLRPLRGRRGAYRGLRPALPPGDPKAALHAGIGMVHQHFTLADNMSVLDNIVLGTQSKWSWRLDRAGAIARIRKLSADFGLPWTRRAGLGAGRGRTPARGDPEGALSRRAHPDPRRADRGADAAGDRGAVCATLKKLVAEGLSIIFISHKLNEVMAVSDRVLVLRGGRLVGERRTAETTRQELASLMVGQDVRMPEPRPAESRRAAARLRERVDRPAPGRQPFATSRSNCAPARSPAWPASPATARARSPP
jgi:general nucleoside transport system ATP-binding protein